MNMESNATLAALLVSNFLIMIMYECHFNLFLGVTLFSMKNMCIINHKMLT